MTTPGERYLPAPREHFFETGRWPKLGQVALKLGTMTQNSKSWQSSNGTRYPRFPLTGDRVIERAMRGVQVSGIAVVPALDRHRPRSSFDPQSSIGSSAAASLQFHR